MFLFDVHTHTAEVSPCGVLTAEETVANYVSLGYHGIVVTDHFNSWVLSRLPGSTWAEKIESYTTGYRRALAAGQKAGLTVLFGMEMKAADYAYNEYLVYGISPDDLAAQELLYDRPLSEITAVVHACGGLIFQAHPFRNGMQLSPAEDLDGIEAYNGNPRHNSSNDVAIQTAKQCGCLMVSGSDSHQVEDAGHGGLVLFERPETSEDLVRILRSNHYALIANPEKM